MSQEEQPSRDFARAQSMAIFVAVALFIYLSWLLIRPFLWVVMWAIVMCVLFYPVHEKIQKRLKSPAAAAALSTVLVVITILVPTALVARSVANEVPVVIERAPQMISR